MTSLEERIAKLEKMIEERHYVPKRESWVVPLQTSSNRCSKCGIKLDTAMCYTCINSDCPCGMGPTMC